MTTAEGMRSVMSVSQTISTPAGPRTAGAQFSFIARRRNRDTDLTTGALITRVVPTPDDPRGLDVVTNVAAGFRVQIPADGAALLISKDRQHPTAVLITAQWPAKK
ncbi:MAG: hypothetical protein EPO07_06180 [Verrucomicrobia bacterium]|nr:MAG: hypothetical protein EPO07_06180 [Verrucomicrobiota bacterium]